MPTLLALVIGLAPAHAAVPLVHSGATAADAVAATVAATGLPPEQLAPVSLKTVLSAAPRAVGAAALRHCAGAATRGPEVRAHVVRAEAAWRDGDERGAMDQLDLGIARLGCLTEKVDTVAVTRLFLLRGGLLARAERPEDARAELVTALGFTPAAVWDEWLPSDGRSLLDTLHAEPAAATLTVAPMRPSTGPWVDGHAPMDGGPFSLRPGLHLVQAATPKGIRSAWMTVEGDATLVLPASFRAPVLGGLSESQRWLGVARLLESTQQAEAVYAAADGGVWLVSFEQAEPVVTVLAAPPVPEPDDGKKRRRKDRRR
jgi:hypothetical protein